MLKQKTLKDSFSLSGKGLHTGLDLTVTFNPAPDNHGYKIQRIDVEGQPTFDAVADNVTETTRGTVFSKNGVKVSTVEHGMAALYALGIDNCLIQVNGPEFPILDGSAQYYVNEIERVGTVEQNAVKDFYIIKSKIEFRDETTGSSIIVLPDENFSSECTGIIRFNHHPQPVCNAGGYDEVQRRSRRQPYFRVCTRNRAVAASRSYQGRRP